MKSLKANKAKLGVLLTLCATFLCCTTTAFTGIFGNKFPASAATVDLTLDADGKIDKTGLNGLFGQISGGDATLDAVKEKINATAEKGIPVADTTVTLGGLSWHVVYASTVNKPASAANNGAGEQGDVVATLWLEGVAANSLSTTPWNSAYTGGTVNVPYNLYGNASVRGEISERWAELLETYGSYISTPAQIGYQATEDYKVNGYGANSLPNEAYGNLTGVETNWSEGYDFTQTEGYGDWQTDKLWFPSLTEVGQVTDGVNGIWQIDNEQRKTEGSRAVWTRSGASGNYVNAYVLTPDGGYTTIAVNQTALARPAMHLNLSAAYRTELDDQTDISANLGSLNKFFSDLTGGDNTYKAVEDKFNGNASGTLTAAEINGGAEVKVNFGGYKWTVTSLSKAAVTGYPSNGGVGGVGDIVATLWLDEAWRGEGLNAQWDATEGKAYSASYVRNLIAGSSAAEIWKNLTENYGSYLSSPAQIGYQIPSISTSASWQYDKIWLPALSEVAEGGTWGVSAAQKSNGVNAEVWLRSADKSGNPHYLAADGSDGVGVSDSVNAVRPAIHVNLKVLALSGYGEDLPEVISESLEYNGKLQEVINYGSGVKLVGVEVLNNGVYEAVSDETIYNKDECDDAGVFKISDVGTFKVTFALKDAKTNFNSNVGSVWNIDDVYATQAQQTENKSVTVTITPRKLTVNWVGENNKFEYGYNAAGQRPAVFDYEFTEGEDAYEHLVYTYVDADGNALAEGDVPTKAGAYTVTAKLDGTKYFVLVNAAGDVIKESSKEYKIIAVEHNGIVWTGNTAGDNAFVFEFNGLAQAPTAAANGLFEGDESSDVNLLLTYATKGSSRYSTEVPKFPGKYTIKIIDEDGNYVFANKDYEITKKKVEVSWSGDGLSTYEDYTFVWMYDGQKHIPQPTANVTGVTLDGVDITSLKLNPVTAISKEASESNYTVTASLDASDSLNAYFELTGTEQDYRIIPCAIESIEWRYYSGEIIVGEPSFQYIEVYGVEGPRMAAYGVAKFFGRDENNKPVNTVIRIELLVRYSNDTANDYWAVNTPEDEIEDYYAEVGFANTDDGRYCTSLDGLDRKKITFYVTELVTVLKKIDVIWAVEHDGVYYTLETLKDANLGFVTVEDGVFTYIYNGQVQAPVAVYLKGEEYVKLDVSQSTQVNVGNYSVYLLPSTEFQFDDSQLSCNFAIKPLGVNVSWTGDGDVSDFVWTYDGNAHGPAATAASAVDGISITLTADDISVNGATNAGAHTATAAVSANYVIVSGATQSFTINKKEITADFIEWTDEDGNPADENGEFIWIHDGNAHTLKVVVKSGFGFNPVLKVVGEASDVGTHYAYAVLDNKYEINDNFSISDVSHEFIITRLTVNAVTWLERDADSGKIEFTYDGTPKLPTAVYIPNPDSYNPEDDTTYVKLNVWGEATNAGTYVAYITNDFYFEGGIDRHEFTINPAELEVEWTVAESYVYNTKAQSPEVTFTGASQTLVKDTDYTVSAFVNAGSHLSVLTLLNKNYVLKAGQEAEKAFAIGKYEIGGNLVVWQGDENSEETEGVYSWQYNAQPHNPVIKAVADLENTDSFINGITFTFGYTGVSQTVDSHEVTAFIISAKLGGADVGDNFVFTAKCAYEITPYEIDEIIWYKDGVKLTADEACEWTYDGAEHSPEAYYVNWNGDEVKLSTEGGRLNAGSNYVVTALQPANCTIVGEATRAFSIAKQVVNSIIWYKDADGAPLGEDEACEWDYDGLSHNPVAKFMATGADGKQFEVELNVTGGALNAVEKCTATASLRDVNNYEFAKDLKTSLDFSIKAMQVYIVWETNDEGESNFTYSGSLIVPKAWLATFDGVNYNKIQNSQGNDLEAPVIGGAVVAGEYRAEAVDIFSNYQFVGVTYCVFNIVEQQLNGFEWSTQPDNDGNYNFEFGAVNAPSAITKNENAGVVYTVYKVTNGEDGSEILTKVAAINGAGTYKLVASSDNANYVVPEASATVTVVVAPKQVAVVWGATELSYTGSSLKPVAWFEDVNGQKILLEVSVTGESVEAGEYTAVASLAEGVTDYVLSSDVNDVSTTFTVVKSTLDEVEYDWENNTWEEVKEGGDAGDGDTSGGITPPTEPEPTTPPTTEPETTTNNDGNSEEVVEEEPATQPEDIVLTAVATAPEALSTVNTGAFVPAEKPAEIAVSTVKEVATESDVLEPEKQQKTVEKKKLDSHAESEEN